MQDKLREIAGRIWYDARTYGEVLQELEHLVRIIQEDLQRSVVAQTTQKRKQRKCKSN